MRTKHSPAEHPTLGQIWDTAIELGIEAGHRDARVVWQVCERNQARYAKMSAEKKRSFDKTRLKVPFGDCRIYTGRRSKRIRGLLAGIDSVPEAALRVYELNTQPEWNIDLLFIHHAGNAWAAYAGEDYCVPDARCLAEHHGVPVKLMRPIESEARKLARLVGWGQGRQGSVNLPLHMRVMGTAAMCREIDVAHVSIHTPCDVFLWRAVWEVINGAGPESCQDTIDAAYCIPEFRRFRQQHQQPIRMFAGKPGNRLGLWYNANCAATVTLNEACVRALKEAGFDSIVGVVYEGPVTEAAKKYGLNVVHLPHDPADTLGINGFLDRLVERWPALEVLAFGSFFRVERPRPGAWTEAES